MTTVKQIAERINKHLERFENNPEINRYDDDSTSRSRLSGLRPYYGARAWANGRFVRVIYIAYQGSTAVPKNEAAAYLEWLDAGHVGRHFEFQKERAKLAAQQGKL